MPHSVTDCLCEKQLADTLSAIRKEQPESLIYQTSLMSALLSGVYEGSRTIADLLKKGDFGLGTFNRLDGELIAFNSQVYQLRADGSANAARPDQRTPFAVMTFFQPQYHHHFDGPADRDAVHEIINQQISSDNQFCALRIDGRFSQVATRTVPCQHRPYKPMMEAVEQQPTFHFDQRDGVLIGFRTPQYMQGINVAGYHEHFITDDRQGGGHVLNYSLESGVLTFGAISKLVVDLPEDPDFLQANLNPDDLDSAIRAVES
ncbi:acetolactate decarboxylase [Mixta calida]|uniref:acetolactate decarboxylase n=1 Tax=Mixta calida TaxID=665913 RepID=UPI000535A284|nr:acetolactate decarboxylase [Mixta calida]AIX75353.1 alpha-acetolactate decarboxylase [Pantoea sp. PSNIH2]POU46773.1 acetolactate decarboxylase [Pantoea sp. PSNIH5]POU67356.1 acetolactate decarboxylase [Pantoea sp. PSNIH4]POY67639.1 acetolactate decarboxylase [Pantoea sp. PSNIH3]HCW46034.1 acetolactate decarboxylase [Erwiniaceae bacterium]